MVEVGNSNNFNQPFIHWLFHGHPGIHEIFLIGNHVYVLIQWEKVFPKLEAHGPVDEVEVQVIQLQVAERLLAGTFHQVLVVIRAPQLKPGREHVLAHRLEARWLRDRGLAFRTLKPTDFTVMLSTVGTEIPLYM